MPRLVDRDDSEGAIALLLARIFNEQRGEIKTRLGDPPSLAGVPGSFWTGLERSTAIKLKPKLKEVHLAAALALLGNAGQPIEGNEAGLSLTALEAKADDFAEVRSNELAQQLTDNTRERVEKLAREHATAVAGTVATGVLLFGILGAGRAEANAITEVTDAAARGELDTVREFEVQTGLTVVAIWITERDVHVCPICEPLDGRLVEDISLGELGPNATEVKPGINAHPRCRCHLEFEVLEPAGV